MSTITDPITLVIADDHPIFREGLRGALNVNPRFRIVAETDNGADALARVHELSPDVVILDIKMPRMSGLEVAAALHEENSSVKMLILSMYQEEAIFNRAIDCGVTGYLLKDSASADLVKAIISVHAGEYFFSPALSDFSMHQSSHPDNMSLALLNLSPTEKIVLRMVSVPKSTRQIADELCISLRTVDNHRFHICQKLGINGNYALLRFALAVKDKLDLY